MNTPEPLPDYDAWALSALLNGRTLNGEIDRVSELNRRFARQLNSTEADGRRAVFDSFLAPMEDGEAAAVVRAVTSADPLTPPPDAEPWPALRLGRLPDVPAFPDVLPPQARQLVEEASSAIGCDPSFVAVDVLAIAAGAIGRSRSLRLSHQFASASLFVAPIGHPGDGKTPALERYASDPVRRLEAGFAKAFQEKKACYAEAVRAHKKDDGPPPAPPVPVRLAIDDTTVEAMFRVLAANKRGLLMIRDELSAMISGLNQYRAGAGNDLPNFLKIWSGSAFSIDRVLNEFGEAIFIPHPMLTIVGNLTPASLPKLLSKDGDEGFLDRWLFAFPDRRRKLKSSQRGSVAARTLDDWSDVIRRLWMLELERRDDHDHPKVVTFSAAGRDEYNRLYDRHVDEVNAPDFPDSLRGSWSKLEEYAGRLCLVLTVLRHACDPTADQETVPSAEARDARDAWALVDFFKAHHERVRAYLQGKGFGGAPEGVQYVLRWIGIHAKVESFPESELIPNRLDRYP